MEFIIGIIIIIISSIFLFLFRNPSLNISSIIMNDKNAIVSPAYGKIYKIQKKSQFICITIILTIFDVHYQYVPCDGQIAEIVYDRSGQFNIVEFGNYHKTHLNEKMMYKIITINGTILVYQIAGYYFRRIKKYINEKQYVKKGQLLGLITFGSRVDIHIPINNFRLCIKEKTYIRAGELIGRYNSII